MEKHENLPINIMTHSKNYAIDMNHEKDGMTEKLTVDVNRSLLTAN